MGPEHRFRWGYSGYTEVTKKWNAKRPNGSEHSHFFEILIFCISTLKQLGIMEISVVFSIYVYRISYIWKYFQRSIYRIFDQISWTEKNPIYRISENLPKMLEIKKGNDKTPFKMLKIFACGGLSFKKACILINVCVFFAARRAPIFLEVKILYMAKSKKTTLLHTFSKPLVTVLILYES